MREKNGKLERSRANRAKESTWVNGCLRGFKLVCVRRESGHGGSTVGDCSAADQTP